MAFQVSPGVRVSEIDLTTVVPGVSTNIGGFAGVFRWGPIDQLVLAASEIDLVNRFGKPTNFNAETFFSAANFLSYGGALFINRAANTTDDSGSVGVLTAVALESSATIANTFNASSGVNATADTITLPFLLDFSVNDKVVYTVSAGNTAVGGLTANATYYVKTVSQNTVDDANTTIISLSATRDGAKIELTAGSSETGHTLTRSTVEPLQFVIKNQDDYDSKVSFDNLGLYMAKYPGKLGDSLKISVCDSANTYESVVNFKSDAGVNVAATKIQFVIGSNTATVTIANAATFSATKTIEVANSVLNAITVGDYIAAGNTTIGKQYLKVTGTTLTEGFLDIAQTFTSSSGVNGSTEEITISGTTTGFAVDMPVLYTTPAGNTAVGGLSNNTTYYIKTLSTGGGATTITLSSTIGGSTIDLTAKAQSESHNLVRVGSGNSTVTINFASKYNLAQNAEDTQFTRNWEFFNVIDRAPGKTFAGDQAGISANDALHVVVVDENGDITGIKNNVLEVFPELSRGTDAKTEDGATAYYKEVINDQSAYVWWANDRSGAASGLLSALSSSTNSKPLTLSFTGGSDGADESTLSIGTISLAFDKFASPEDVDVSFLLTGKARGGSHGEQLPNYIIDNVADVRKDCIVFVSPDRADVVNNIGSEAADIVEFRNALTASSYGFLDSGYKYQYDKYNDVYRYIPLNGDIAGLAVRSDNERDPWYSPAGFSRGVIKNIVKLAYNPKQADRDTLYKSDVNPVVAFPGQGIILFGDKTLLGRPSAFDRINVRRLFIVLEKAIAVAARSYLFEFNDEFTRAQFKGLVDPFLADIQGRRGITDYRVVCDSTNNTAEVIDRNEFVGDIYIKPAKSINYIQLNFVAVRSGVEFNEIVGRF